MLERRISEEEVLEVLNSGDHIENYPMDAPYPSMLMLGFTTTGPLHVVAAKGEGGEFILITTYCPDANKWHSDFKRRKP